MTQLTLGFAAHAGRVMVAGIDEVGRGPLAGPVVAAAVVLPDGKAVDGLTDSKALSPRRREALAAQIRERAVDWALGRAEVAEIDRLNILNATMLAMQRAVRGLKDLPQQALVDGNRCPDLGCRASAVIGGDRTVPCISAASILAKVARDAEMVVMDEIYPGYGFAQHKGYGTAAHRAALQTLGPAPIHRRSFAPVGELLARAEDGAGEAGP